MQSGSEWFNCMERSRKYWQPRLLESNKSNLLSLNLIKDLFIHLIVFEDGFQTTRTQLDVSSDATYLSAGNFPYTKRWRTFDYPSMLPILIRNKKSVDHDNPNVFHNLLTSGFKKAASGVDVFCPLTNCTYRVFGILLVVLGDLPGRCEIAGLKSGAFAEKMCHTCEMTKTEHSITFDEEFIDQDPLILRDGTVMKRIAKSLGANKANKTDSPVLYAKGKKYGINYYAGT